MSDYVEVDPVALRRSADDIRETADGFDRLSQRLDSVCGPWVNSSDPARASFGRSIAPSVQQVDDAFQGLKGFCVSLGDAVVQAADNYEVAQQNARQRVDQLDRQGADIDTTGIGADDEGEDEDEGYVAPGTSGRR